MTALANLIRLAEPIQPEWTLDCQGKQDYDADLLRLSCRYYPRGGGFSVFAAGQWEENGARPEIKPSAIARIIWGEASVVAESNFDGETEGEVKAKVEKWAADQIEAIRATLSPAELGGVELPVGQVSDGFSGSQRAVHLYGPIRCQPAPGTKLYTTPRAAEGVTATSKWDGQAFERAYATGYRAALGAAAAECRKLVYALDHGGREYVRPAEAMHCLKAAKGTTP